jgi:fused signal recognition particle receptor
MINWFRKDRDPAPEVGEPVSKGFFEHLKERLSRTRETLVGRVDHLLLGKKEIDPACLEELEEILITSDLGVAATRKLVGFLEDKVNRKELDHPEVLKTALKEKIRSLLEVKAAPLDLSRIPTVILVVGVNGVGKTTTIGKLAWQFKNQGKRVLLVAGDTFRAAAIEQLMIWGERVGAGVIRHQMGSDPSAVAFDGLAAARAQGAEVVLIDTAGRLQTKVNLMEELRKIRRIISRELPGAPHETLLVLDATTGQNALSQARLFHEAVELTGVVLTKLDGTAKGGMVVAIAQELGLPIRFIGIGEKLEDLIPFEAGEFVEAIF